MFGVFYKIIELFLQKFKMLQQNKSFKKYSKKIRNNVYKNTPQNIGLYKNYS